MTPRLYFSNKNDTIKISVNVFRCTSGAVIKENIQCVVEIDYVQKIISLYVLDDFLGQPKYPVHFSWFDFYEENPHLENECQFIDFVFDCLLFIKGAIPVIQQNYKYPCYDGFNLIPKAMFGHNNEADFRRTVNKIYNTGAHFPFEGLITEYRMNRCMRRWEDILIKHDAAEDSSFIASHITYAP